MIRPNKAPVVIDKNGWANIVIEEGFPIPKDIVDPQAYITREKIKRYVDGHPERIYHYFVDDVEHTIDCKASIYAIRKSMESRGAAEHLIVEAVDIAAQLRKIVAIIQHYTHAAIGHVSSATYGILDGHSEELLDMFGSLYSCEEVHRRVLQEWGLAVNISVVRSFYNRNLKEIERLRDQYSTDYSDIGLTKKRGRLDKLSIMFYTYYNKWTADERLDYSRELRAILDQIKKEVEGEQINVNVTGQINVDLTIEVNKTLAEAYKRIPVNNIILAMVAAKRGIDPTKLMTQLTTSYYRSLTGFGAYEPEKQLVHPVDLTYNWNEIERKHTVRDKTLMIEDARIVEGTGTPEKDIEMNTYKNRLLELLDKDKSINDKRKSGK